MSKCSEFMICDWLQDNHQFPMQVRVVGEDYLYADFDGNEADMWEFDDKLEPSYPIPLTEEILKKNGFEVDDKPIWRSEIGIRCSYSKRVGDDFIIHTIDIDEYEESGQFTYGIDSCLWQGVTINYVHELQQALRLAGMKEIADNFKI